tara:strand:- start:331 stop:873 length:543 start_codon:yes stop_codon:yes gene_type:complete
MNKHTYDMIKSPRDNVAEGEVVDTSALISWPLERLFGSLASPRQRNELMNNYPDRLEIIDAIGINWEDPGDISIEKIIQISKKTGDISGLSQTDIEILALAMKNKYILITDDYRMQNLAEYSEIKWRSVNTDGIKDIWEWEVVCIGCKIISKMPSEPTKKKKNLGECVECGSKLKSRKKK